MGDPDLGVVQGSGVGEVGLDELQGLQGREGWNERGLSWDHIEGQGRL